MLCVRGMDRQSNVVIRIDGSYGTIALLIAVTSTEGVFSPAYGHNGRLRIRIILIDGIIPEKEPPKTTTTCLFAGAMGDVDVRWTVKASEEGGSDE